MTAEIIPLPTRAPEISERETMLRLRAQARYHREQGQMLIAKANDLDRQATDIEARIKAAEYVAAHVHSHPPSLAASDTSVVAGGNVGPSTDDGGVRDTIHKLHAEERAPDEGETSGEPVENRDSGTSSTIQGQRTADPSDGEPIEPAGVGGVSALPGPTNSLSPLSSEPGSSLPDSAPAFPYTCSGGCGARVEKEFYVCLECKRRPKCASCKGTGIWSADEDMGRGSDVTMSACPKCTPRPGTCTFVLNDGSLCGSNPHEGTNRCPFHTFFGHTPTGAIVATAIPALDPRNIFTNSHLKCGRRCARERHLAYDLGIRSTRESAAANFGTMGHAALEAWFRASTDDERLEAAIAAIEAFDADSADPFDRAKARALIKGYHAMWIDEPWEVLAVEVELPNVPILHPDTGDQHPWAVSGGKIDVVIRKDGHVFNVDHKFLSGDTSIGSHFWRLLRMDSQISTYLDGVEALGYGKPHGHIHDVISKPGLRPLLATPEESRRYTKGGKLDKRQRLEDESPEDYEARILAAIAAAPQKFYARETVVRLDVEMEEHRRDVWDQVEAVGEAREANRFPRNVDACERFGSLCPFWRHCAGEASLDDPEHFRKVAWVHSELTAPNVNQENDNAAVR